METLDSISPPRLAAVDRSADRAGELEAEDEEVFQECDDDAR